MNQEVMRFDPNFNGEKTAIPSVLVQAVLAGADEKEGEEQDGEFDGVGGGLEALAFAQMHGRGDDQGDQEKEARGAEEEAKDKEHAAERLREGGHQAPEDRGEMDAHVADRKAELVPGADAAGQLVPAVDVQIEGPKGDAQKEEAPVAEFGKGGEDHVERLSMKDEV